MAAMSIRLLVISMVLATSAAWCTAAENWPQFRGPGASGVSPTTCPVKWDVKTSENVRWKTPVPGMGHSSPVIWEDRLFITTAVPVEVAAS